MTLKTAMSLDGKIATFTGASRWITGEVARQRVHEYRDVYDGILAGIGTVLSDDPSLTARLEGGAGKNPVRIIADSMARTPVQAKLLTDGAAPVLIAVTEAAPADRVEALKAAGAELIVAGPGPQVDMTLLMKALGERDITSVFVEGGGTVNFSLLKAGLVDKVYAFVAPKLIGGREAKTPVEGEGFAELSEAAELTRLEAETVGRDVLLTGYVKKEMALYLRATDDAKEFSKASSFWDNIKTKRGKINSAYGNLIFNKSLKDGRSQFDWAFDSLKNDKDSRQSFMRFNNTNHQYDGNKDVPCTFLQLFHIRDNKLNTTVEMRSNDIIKGTTYDIPSFILFQRLMLLRLREVYPDLELGTYTHFANSFHLYATDFDLVEKRLNSQILENAYPFPNDWHCIKSEDALKCFDIKVNKQNWLDDGWQCPENKDFYEWLCK